MQFYCLLREDCKGEISVSPARLKGALLVLGYSVKVFGATDGKTYYFCSTKGVNELGVTWECCTSPSETDAVFLNVCWQLGHSTFVSGYECLLKILTTYDQPSLKLMVLLLGPFVKVMEYYVIDNSWTVLQHMERNFSTVGEMMRMSQNTYHKAFQYLTKALDFDFESVFYPRKFFMKVLIHLHTISRWSVS